MKKHFVSPGSGKARLHHRSHRRLHRPYHNLHHHRRRRRHHQPYHHHHHLITGVDTNMFHMRHNKRLTFLRIIIAFFAIFSTSIFITNLFLDVGSSEKGPTLISRGRRAPTDPDAASNNLSTTPNSPAGQPSPHNEALENKTEVDVGRSSMDEVERLKLQADGLHRELSRLA